MDFKEGFCNGNGIKIHYIDNNLLDKDTTTLLICPGLSESAEDYMNLMSRIKDRRCVSFSFRGRGKSHSPSEGYKLENHVEDIVSLVKELELNEFCIMGVSRGVSYELGYAIENSKYLKGIILDEYPAMHKQMPAGWAKECMDFYNEYCDSISITYDVLKCIEDESYEIRFIEKLSNIKCPALILKGELEESLLSSKDIIDYVDNLGSKSTRVEKFEKAGHDIQSDDFEGLVKVINEFLVTID